MRSEFRRHSFACKHVALLILIAFCLPAAASRAQETPTAARPPAVQCPDPGLVVDVIESVLKFRAFEGDRSVLGLQPDDVRVWDEGKLREISSFVPTNSVNRQVVMLVDSSGSMSRVLRHLQEALSTFADLITDGHKSETLRLSLIEFNDQVRTVVAPTTDPEAFKKKTDEIRVGGDTALVDAILTAIGEGFAGGSTPPNAKVEEKRRSKYLIVFTDAGENSSRHRWSEIGSTLLGEDVAIYGVIFNANEADENLNQMARIASQSGGKLFLRADVNDLKSIHAEIAKDIRSFYELTFKVPADEIVVHRWRNLKISIPARPGLSIVSQTGYCPKIPCQTEDGSFVGGRPLNFAAVCSMNNASTNYVKTLETNFRNVVFDSSRDTEKIIKDLEKEKKPVVVVRDWRVIADSAKVYTFRTVKNSDVGDNAETCTLDLFRSGTDVQASLSYPAEPVQQKGLSFRVLRAASSLRLRNQQAGSIDFQSRLTFLMSDVSRKVSFPIAVYCSRPRFLVDDDLISLAIGAVESALKVKARSSGR